MFSDLFSRLIVQVRETILGFRTDNSYVITCAHGLPNPNHWLSISRFLGKYAKFKNHALSASADDVSENYILTIQSDPSSNIDIACLKLPDLNQPPQLTRKSELVSSSEYKADGAFIDLLLLADVVVKSPLTCKNVKMYIIVTRDDGPKQIQCHFVSINNISKNLTGDSIALSNYIEVSVVRGILQPGDSGSPLVFSQGSTHVVLGFLRGIYTSPLRGSGNIQQRVFFD